MLEEKWSYAEQIVKRQRRYQKTETINYLEPENQLEDGFFIINYKKRMVERKIMAEGKVSMIVPKDWRQADIEEEGFCYYSPFEKEVFMLMLLDDQEVEDMSVLEWEEEEYYYYSFCKTGEKHTFRGIFRFHKYRKKTWKKIIPQIVESMKMGDCDSSII